MKEAGRCALFLACFTVVGAKASCETNVTEFLPAGVFVGCGLGGSCYNPKGGGCGYSEAMPLEIISGCPCRLSARAVQLCH